MEEAELITNPEILAELIINQEKKMVGLITNPVEEVAELITYTEILAELITNTEKEMAGLITNPVEI